MLHGPLSAERSQAAKRVIMSTLPSKRRKVIPKPQILKDTADLEKARRRREVKCRSRCPVSECMSMARFSCGVVSMFILPVIRNNPPTHACRLSHVAKAIGLPLPETERLRLPKKN